MGVFIVLVVLLVIFLTCSVVCGFGVECSFCNAKFLSKIPFLVCGFCLFLLLLAVGIALLSIMRIGKAAIEASCDDTNADGTEETNNVKEFFEKIYTKMDDYYCQDYYCPCKIDSDTFS